MARSKGKAAKAAGRVSEAKVAMSYRLSRAKIARAQRILGTPTATATIEEALDMIIFRRELVRGVEEAFGLPMVEAFPDPGNKERH